MTNLLRFVILLRPNQWYKNLLVFAAALFSHNAFNLPLYPRLLAAFLLLSLVSGCSYVLNDTRDVEADRAHPVKARRPIASGNVSVPLALAFMGAVLIPSLALAYLLGVVFALACVSLFLLNMLYTFALKQILIADVLTISVGFLIRGIAGGVIIPVPVSSWFVFGVFFAALLLALGKRRGELRTLKSAELHRSVLGTYNGDLLSFGMSVASTLVIVFYALYVTLGPPQGASLLATLPVVVYMVFRYFHLASSGDGQREAADILFFDRPMVAAGTILIGLIVVLLYFFPQ